jgi:cellulose biosynthesis protein BcsQ
MRSYAFWNNKGGVGKSFLCFISSCEYARLNPTAKVYVIDLCPQANTTETLLGGYEQNPNALQTIIDSNKKVRPTIAGYLETRLNSPFQMISNPHDFVVDVKKHNAKIPDNLKLICGDNLVEILGEAIRQTSQLSIPVDSWNKVINWVRDLIYALDKENSGTESVFFIDCNPSFAMYTQLAMAAADSIIVPFTADDSSRRALENIAALLYGVGDGHVAAYTKISFAGKAKDNLVSVPKLSYFINNRVTVYDGQPSAAFKAASKAIKKTMDDLYTKHKTIFLNPAHKPSESLIDIPDYHSACVYATSTGTPIYGIKPGPKTINGERTQLNKDPLDRYKNSLTSFVQKL